MYREYNNNNIYINGSPISFRCKNVFDLIRRMDFYKITDYIYMNRSRYDDESNSPISEHIYDLSDSVSDIFIYPNYINMLNKSGKRQSPFSMLVEYEKCF